MDIEEIQRKAEEGKVSIELIFKEYLHAIILDFFFKKNIFNLIVFQGGTAIRFFYKGVRYSEDLDFVLKNKSSSLEILDEKIKEISSFVERNIPFVKKSELKIQKQSSLLKRYILISEVDILKMKDKTRIEIGLVPSYTHKVHFFKTEYLPFPPAVVVETPEEILIDKVVSFGGREYLKGRDIWDIHFLIENLKVKIDKEQKRMIEKKRRDYKIKKEKFRNTFTKNLFLIKTKGKEILLQEMRKYLPVQYREILENQYSNICEKISEFLSGWLK